MRITTFSLYRTRKNRAAALFAAVFCFLLLCLPAFAVDDIYRRYGVTTKQGMPAEYAGETPATGNAGEASVFVDGTLSTGGGNSGARPASADTVGPPPAEMPQEDDKPVPLSVSSSAAAPQSDSVPKVKIFDTVEFKRPLSSLPEWMGVIERNKAKPVFLPNRRFNKSVTWDHLKEQAGKLQGLDLLRFVNRFYNSWPYVEDIVNWKVEDYWEIPAEFLERSGDCEDYAIIKYFTLKELGISPENMRIVVVRDTIRNLGHAILIVYMQNDAFVLDNLSNVVLSNTRFHHYSPQYSVNEFGRWAHLKGRQAK